MTLNALLYVNLYVNHQNAILVAKNLKMLSVMLNVKNLIVKLNVLIKLVRPKIAQNALQFANNPIAWLIVKHLNPNVKLFVLNLYVIGNVVSLCALNPNAN